MSRPVYVPRETGREGMLPNWSGQSPNSYYSERAYAGICIYCARLENGNENLFTYIYCADLILLQPNEKQFLAPSISRLIANALYGRNMHCLASSAYHTGVLNQQYTGTLVCFMATAVWHAIREWKTGAHTLENFNGNSVMSKYYQFRILPV